MKRSLTKLREEARRLFLTGEMATNAEIASLLGVKPHTVGRWHRAEDWDTLRRKIDRRAAELFAEKIANERVTLNTQHFQLWGLTLNKLLEAVKSGDGEEITSLLKIAGIIERAQKGQRLARGLTSDAETEEQIRTDSQAEIHRLIDTFTTVIKDNVHEETTRERIRQAILSQTSEDEDDGARQNR